MPSFSESISTPLFASIKNSFLWVECLALGLLIFQSNFDLNIMLMGFTLSLIHLIIFYSSKISNINLYPVGLPVSFLFMLFFNSQTPQSISFVGYLTPIVFYGFFLINMNWLKNIYLFIFLLGASLSEIYKGTTFTTILFVLVPAVGFILLFKHALSFLQKTHQMLISQNKELQESKSNLNALIEHTNSLIWCLDRDYKYLRGNLKFKKNTLLNLKQEIQPGNNMIDLLVDPNQATFWKTLIDRGLSGESFIAEEIIKSDGLNKYWEFNINAMSFPNGDIYGVTIVAKGTTKKKERELKLEEQNKRLEEYNFTLSHVIRRPVANLVSLTSLLSVPCEFDEEDLKTISHIHESVKQLDDIIKELNSSISIITPSNYETKNYSN